MWSGIPHSVPNGTALWRNECVVLAGHFSVDMTVVILCEITKFQTIQLFFAFQLRYFDFDCQKNLRRSIVSIFLL